MKRLLIIALAILFSVGTADVTAQSFLKKIEKAAKKEVKEQVDKRIKKKSKKKTNNNSEKQAQKEETQEEQTQEEQTQQQNNNKKYLPPGAIAPIVVDSEPTYATTGTSGGHAWVDLGLPSGTRWATCNVGATKTEQPGQYFAWGEISPKTSYTESNSKTRSKTMTDISGNKTYDAAAAKWGNGWRMPTKEELGELLHYSGWGYKQMGGRWGAELGSFFNKESIFLPATGYKEGSKLHESSGTGSYWMSTPYTDKCNNGATDYHFGGALGEMGTAERSYGFAIRPVIDNDDMVSTPSQGETNGHEWVDLGLPSGTKWATCNIGANSSENHGEFFAWGETTNILDKKSPKNNTRDKWMSGIGGSTKYDAATANWGEGWKMPTKKDFEELKEHCTWEWITLGRAKGCKVTSKINGNYIFLPATGYLPKNYSYSHPNGLYKLTRYWASTPSKDTYNINADAFNICQDWVGTTITDRKDGHPIRPVTK